MLAYALRRLLLAVPLLLGITFVSFIVIHLAPGEPVEIQTGDMAERSSTRGLASRCARCTGSTSRCTCSTGTG